MINGLKIIPNTLLEEFRAHIDFDLVEAISTKSAIAIPFDYFSFHNTSVAL